jgi:hypothetical protein
MRDAEEIREPASIFVIVHMSLVDVNFFYLTREKAEWEIPIIASRLKKSVYEFKIIELKEGVAFEADFSTPIIRDLRPGFSALYSRPDQPTFC